MYYFISKGEFKMKRTICALIALSIVFGLVANIGYAEEADDYYSRIAKLVQETWVDDYIESMSFTIGDPVMSVDGTDKEIDPGRNTVPLLIDDRTMLPVRAIVEEFGGTIEWNEDTRQVRIYNSGIEIVITIDDADMVVNGETETLDVEAFTSNERTYLPLRAVSEALGCKVEWDDLSETASIFPEFQSKRLMIKAYEKPDLTGYAVTDVIETPGGFYIAQFSDENNAKMAYEALINSENVEYVDIDKYFSIYDQETEASAAETSNVGAASVGGSLSWGTERINAVEYGDYLREKNKNSAVRIAVLDTGVDYNHNFLRDKIQSRGRDFINEDYDAMDDNKYEYADKDKDEVIVTNTYHGTHVAGIIADCTKNLNTQILPIKVLDDKGSGTWAVLNCGIDYVVDHKSADVINMSITGLYKGEDKECKSIYDKIKRAVDSGITVVMCAGNDGDDTSLHAPSYVDINGSIVVSATDKNDKATDFSNYGDSVDVAAPGDEINSTSINNTYRLLNGTSMAAPHISAIAAMIKMYNKAYTPEEIESIIKSISKRCTPYVPGKNYGGIPDMNLLMNNEPPAEKDSVDPTPAPCPTSRPTAKPTERPTPSPTKPTAKPQTVVKAEEVWISPSDIDLYIGESADISVTIYPSNTTNKNWYSESENSDIAELVSGNKILARSEGKTRIRISSADGAAYSYCYVTVHEDVIPAESIQFLRRNISISVGESYEMVALVSPPNADDAELVWSSDDPGVVTVDSNGTLKGVSAGTAEVTAKLKNRDISATATVSVMDNSKEEFSIRMDKDTYIGAYDEDIDVKFTMEIPNSSSDSSKKYILWIAYMDGGWQQCVSMYVDGGTNRYNYTINAEELGIPINKKEVRFAFSLFNADNFTTGASIVDSYITLKLE